MEVTVEQLKKEANQPTGQEANAPIPGEKDLIREITKDNILDDAERDQKRREAIARNSVEPVDFAYERAIGRNDSLYSNFAELIALTKRKVCRIVTKENGSKTSGTGFMVSSRLLLTNWHVFKTKQMAEDGEAHFFYEYDAFGHPISPVIFRFDTTGFFNNKLLDYCFVAVHPMDVTGTVSLESIGYLYLDPTTGKVGAKGLEKLNIIHHPMGDYKQISIRENTFKDVTKTKITYETDTAPGSSGSPVLNDQWQVVGLHHKSVAKMSPDGKDYVDRDGFVIPVQNGKVDATRIFWEKNEGIRISVILKHVAKSNPNNELIAGLAHPPPPENLFFATRADSTAPAIKAQSGMAEVLSHQNKEADVVNDNGTHININVPVNALSSDQSIEISLSRKTIGTGKTLEAPLPRLETLPASTAEMDDIFLETAKVGKEKAMDFSACTGYDPKFLGVAIPLPQPKGAIRKQIARLINNKKEMELKYFKYSVIFNAVTRMPLISAINVEGDAAQRLDDSKRSDDWLRDPRIDVTTQLTDRFYARSKFDKGHMSRFEDANWDNSDKTDEREKNALRHGVYTCFYTNACPQVPNLNRAGGVWGHLEKAVLEQGIKAEQGRQARMTVFNGPIFNAETDRVFKGVRIPTEFFKIILWLSDENQLKATAFKLTQKDLMGEVDFTAPADEALDIDQDVEFESYQCSINSLVALTGIDFKDLEDFDTFDAHDGGEKKQIKDTATIVLNKPARP